ncbi:HVA1 family protein [Alteromonadaceae bacterium A_SAG2]|nr:HVA1 family protein [Alteromonadaceae bacterium A_SAG2]
MKHYAVNTEVEWEWGNGSATGNIREKFTNDVERTIKGSSVKREASDSDPVYLIEQDDGSKVLKSHSEITKSS